MIIDKETLLSDGQEITVTAASTNILDLGNDDATVQALNEKGQLDLMAQVGTAFAGGTSVDITIQTDDSSTFASATTIYSSGALAAATLAAGYKIKLPRLPRINEQYLRAYYTVVGTMSAGTIHLGLLPAGGVQTNGV